MNDSDDSRTVQDGMGKTTVRGTILVLNGPNL
ncbi:MAG: hypothetical protein QOH19_853, partial [Actinomycetota bacterium]|nr:hypothetical protein [Actinomycetota bacterium]